MITIKDLSEKYGMSTRKVRRILRENNVKKVRPQWVWRDGTKSLEKVKKLLDKYN